MKKIILLLFLAFVSNKCLSQDDINNYKYVIVPLKFDFLKNKNTYRLNTLAKYLFKENGFNVLFDEEELPKDLFKDRCLALYSDVIEEKGGFRKTKLKFVFKDCRGNVIFTSNIGASGDNNHEKAHQEALRKAFDTFELTNYTYQPSKETNKEDRINNKIISKEHSEKVEVSLQKIDDNQINQPEVLYAQPISNGFQIVDDSPKIIMVLLNTGAKDVYIVKDRNAIVFKENESWYYSENNGTLKDKIVLNIKF